MNNPSPPSPPPSPPPPSPPPSPPPPSPPPSPPPAPPPPSPPPQSPCATAPATCTTGTCKQYMTCFDPLMYDEATCCGGCSGDPFGAGRYKAAVLACKSSCELFFRCRPPPAPPPMPPPPSPPPPAPPPFPPPSPPPPSPPPPSPPPPSTPVSGGCPNAKTPPDATGATMDLQILTNRVD